MVWKQLVRDRFSKSKIAEKWRDIYTTETPNVNSISFRERRKYTVGYILENIPEGSVILDLGCGAGPVLTELVEKNYRLVGMDYSPDMLKLARNTLGIRAEGFPLVLADGENIPLRDSSIDCIICLGVISYAQSIDAALDEQCRILRQGGQTIISYRNMYNSILTDPIRLMKHIVSLIFTIHKPEQRKIGQHLSRDEVLRHIKNHSFIVVSEHQIGFGSIRLNGRVLSNGKLAIRANKLLHKFLNRLKLKSIYRAIADIHIFVLEKPA